MPKSRVEKLGALLESKNRLLRQEAVEALSFFPFEDDQLFSILVGSFQSQNWNARVAASEIFETVLKGAFKERSLSETYFFHDKQKMEECIDSIRKINPLDLLANYRLLLSDELDAFSQKSGQHSQISSKEQRKLVDLHLELDSVTGVSSKSFISDEEISNSGTRSLSTAYSTINQIERGKKPVSNDTPISLTISEEQQNLPPNHCEENEEDREAKNTAFLARYFRVYVEGLADQRWYIRHGAALALQRIVTTNALTSLHSTNFCALIVQLFRVLILDQFDDFVSGSNAVAPVREVVAQVLSGILFRAEETGNAEEFVRECLLKLHELLGISHEKHWNCRQTALIVAKYYLSACPFKVEHQNALYEAVLERINDSVDEVVSSAISALSTLIDNKAIGEELKERLITDLVAKIWSILEDETRITQLKEGVDSIIVDILRLIKFCLRSSDNQRQQFEESRLELLIALSDPRFPSRSLLALECIDHVLRQWNNENSVSTSKLNPFGLLKALYRLILFLPDSELRPFVPLIDSLLESFDFAFSMKLDSEDVSNSKLLLEAIPHWISALLYDHRITELDVFEHRLDGSPPSSSSQQRSQPQTKAQICGDEIRFLKEPERVESVFERKVLASHFLGSVMNTIFSSYSFASSSEKGKVEELQKLLLPYLKSNSIFQRLGVACIVKGWAAAFSRRQKKSYQNESSGNGEEYPQLIVGELFAGLQNKTGNSEVYKEAMTAINHLTAECNEFQGYCVRRGVPRAELPRIDHQVGDIRSMIDATYRCCDARLKRAGDRQTLKARYGFVCELIASTEFMIRNSSNRINSLFSASLLLFDCPIPTPLTPLIRPLMESLDSETNESVARSSLIVAFPPLISQTATKSPCPHGKIVRQLCSGLSHGTIADQISNSAANKEDSSNGQQQSSSHAILSLKTFGADSSGTLPQSNRSRNCADSLQAIVAEFGDRVFEVCPALDEAISLPIANNHIENGGMSNNENEEPVVVGSLLALRTVIDCSPSKTLTSTLFSTKAPLTRFRVAQFVASLAKKDLSWTLKHFYGGVRQKLTNIRSDPDRLGAIEVVLHISHLENALLGAVSLIALLALRSISDPVEAVREAANCAFRKLVVFLPIENFQKHCLTDLLVKSSENDVLLSEEYEKSFNLVDVLSSPQNLPMLTTGEFPTLRDHVTLRPYQLEGITWMSFLCRFGLNGILADDMGLGKTLQVLCLLDWEQSERAKTHQKSDSSSPNPSLVVCPRTLVDHWIQEWRQYFPSKCQRALKLDRWNFFGEKGEVEDSMLVISYEELRSNSKKITEKRWNFVVLDEGHCIRNPNTRLYEIVSSLVSSHRLILSGTPVQNSPADLWALFNFLMPEYLFSKAVFNARFLRKIMASRNPKATEEQNRDAESALAELHKQCLPFVMRRLKSEVLRELPEKIVQDYPCLLTDAQRKLYDFVVNSCSASTSTSDEADPTMEQRKISPLHALIILRKLVDHPALVCDVFNKLGLSWSAKEVKELEGIEASGKMMALGELLRECQIGRGKAAGNEKEAENDDESLVKNSISPHRALLFCQWKGAVDLIADFLDRELFGADIVYLRLDGNTPVGERQQIVNRFNRDHSIDLLLLTTHIGGLGLNLTGADTVIFVDHDWNPFKDLQAIDRAHRLGQTRTVNVYRLVTNGTVEEKISSLQKFKQNTANVLVGSDNRSLSSMSSSELMELLAFGGGAGKTPQSAANGDGEHAAPSKKRQKLGVDEEGQPILGRDEKLFSLEELWDHSSEYEEQHSVNAFLDRLTAAQTTTNSPTL